MTKYIVLSLFGVALFCGRAEAKNGGNKTGLHIGTYGGNYTTDNITIYKDNHVPGTPGVERLTAFGVAVQKGHRVTLQMHNGQLTRFAAGVYENDSP